LECIEASDRVEATVQRHPGDPDVAKQPTQFRKAVPCGDGRVVVNAGRVVLTFEPEPGAADAGGVD